jgi:dTDP-4-amino-4,6-dideoxygalactose transaminase
MQEIQMIDLKNQYLQIKKEIDYAIQQCLIDADYINGKQVKIFEQNLAAYTFIKNVISCGNGTDAIQLALMALNLPKGAKVIVPAFTYIAPVEVAVFLGFDIVFADVEMDFNTSLTKIKEVYTEDVKAIIVVHLFGQPINDIDLIYNFCIEKDIALIEDNAQSLGAEKNITRNSIQTTSFYPTKNLGAFGDGGAVLTNDEELAKCIHKIASHGQISKYIHDVVGINSRLDTIQAAILNIKINHLEQYNLTRRQHANYYLNRLNNLDEIELPIITTNHIFHQFTLKIKNGKRDALKEFLKEKKINSIINYPLACHQQKAYQQKIKLPNSEFLCASSLSIPIYPELSQMQLSYICESITDFFNK